MRKQAPIYITATDTGVGKTVTTAVLGALLLQAGRTVGVLKPVQCAGDDAKRLKEILDLADDLSVINPIFAKEPLSPHLALKRAGKKFEAAKIKKALSLLQSQYDQVLIEGAGGLMVPLTDKYYNADLIRDLNAEVIIVSRLGLGTINHTLLTIEQAKAKGLTIRGIIFSQAKKGRLSIAEQTNPAEIQRLSGVRVIGIIPYLTNVSKQHILRQCKHLKLSV